MKAKKIISLLLILVMLISTVSVVIIMNAPTAYSYSSMPDPIKTDDNGKALADGGEVVIEGVTYTVIKTAADLENLPNLTNGKNCILANDITLNSSLNPSIDRNYGQDIESRYHIRGGYIFHGNGYSIYDDAESNYTLFGIWIGDSSATQHTVVRDLYIQRTTVDDCVFGLNDGVYVDFINVDILSEGFYANGAAGAGSVTDDESKYTKGRNNVGAFDSYCNAYLNFTDCDIRPNSVVGKDGVKYNAGTSTNAFGGFIGYLAGGSVTMTKCTVQGSLVNGDVTCGGFVGEVAGGTLTLNNCTSDLTSIEGGKRVSGFIGLTLGGTVQMTSCTNLTKIPLLNEFAGGFIGHHGGGSVTMTSCTNSGELQDASTQTDVSYFKNRGGFIGYYSSGTDSKSAPNLTMTDCKNTVNVTVNKAGNNIGGLIGHVITENTAYSPQIKLTRCSNSGAVSSAGGERIGGLIGMLETKSALTVILENCSNSKTVTSTGAQYVGGLIGDILNNGSYALSVTMNTCSNSGTVSSGASHRVGGLIGAVRNSVTLNATGCSNTGALNDSNYNVGGIIGFVSGTPSVTLTGCTNNAAVKATTTGVGGIIGKVSDAGATVKLDSCENQSSGTISGTSYVGGIIGISASDLTVTSCKNSGKITASDSYAGGIFGAPDPTNGTGRTFTLTNCTNSGNVTATTTCAGGIVGGNNVASVKIVISGASTKNSGAITAGTRAGGIVGGNPEVQYTSSVSISNATNTGTVKATSTAVGGDAGGIVGSAHATTVVSCTNSGTVGAGSYQGGGIAGFLAYASRVESCENTATGTVGSSATTKAGGIVSYLGSSDCAVVNCTNGGAVTAASYAGGISAQWKAAPTTPAISGCINNGNVKGTGEAAKAGGILAYTESGAGGLIVSDCDNNGEVTSSGAATTSARPSAGGIVGANSASLTVQGCTNTKTVSTTQEKALAGGIVGYGAAALTVTDCTNSGNVSATATGAESYTGGIVGYAKETVSISGSDNAGAVSCAGEKTPVGGILGKGLTTTNIADCENTGAVSSTGAKSVAGGIFGLSSGTATVKDCINRGDISCTGEKTTIAGISGSAEAKLTVTDCTNYGDVEAKHVSGSPGGILGTLFTSELATLTGCTNNGNINGYQYTGGIVGMLDNRLKEDSSVSIYPAVKLDSCVNNGTVTLHEHADLQVTATQTAQIICGAGGLIGELHGISRAEITNSINNGLVTTNINNTTTAFSLYSLGGFVGYCYCTDSETAPTETWQTLSVTNSNNLGTVLSDDTYWQYETANDTTTDTGEINKIGNVGIGGFVGNLDLGPTAETMTGATLTTCRNYGHIEGPTHIGGFMGRVAWRSEFHIEDCANYGTVTGNSRVGGLVGYAPSYDKAFTVKDCFNMGLIYSTDNNAGGFLGEARAKLVTFENVLNAGTIRVGGGSIGGIAGYLHSNLLTATFTNCANIGKLINDSTNRTGGLVGGPYAPIMIDCYSYGEIYTNTSLSMGWIAFIDSTASAGVGSSNLQYYTGIMTGSKTTATDATGKDYSSVLTGVSLEAALETLQTNFGDLFGLEFMSERVGTANPQITVATPFLRATQKTASADGKFDIRLISTIDSLDYERVGFLVTTKYGTTTIEHRPASCSYVFVSDWQNGATLSARDDLCGEYMVILTYENVPASGTVTFTVTPYGFRDDTTYLGDTYDVVYTDGVLVSFTRTEGKTP